MDPPERIDLGRVRLRRPTSADVDALFDCGSNTDLARYMDWPRAESIDQINQLLAGRAKSWDSGEEFYWVLVRADSDAVVGAVSCSVEGHSASFGLFVHPQHWNNGYATAAAQAIADWVMSEPTIWRLWATCDVDNLASARVLEKVGLVREGTLRRAIVRPNLSEEPRDAYIYARVR